jgi:osmotically-inducible protein OsmY
MIKTKVYISVVTMSLLLISCSHYYAQRIEVPAGNQPKAIELVARAREMAGDREVVRERVVPREREIAREREVESRRIKNSKTTDSRADETDSTETDTGVNASSGITAEDQTSSNKSDLELTRMIRRDLVKNNSTFGPVANIKIITIDGHVTLRGVVKNPQQRAYVNRVARNHAGPAFVRDELIIEK